VHTLPTGASVRHGAPEPGASKLAGTLNPRPVLGRRVEMPILNDYLVTYLKKKFFFKVKDDAIISRFQALDNQKVVL
jgi:hypothetical protein